MNLSKQLLSIVCLVLPGVGFAFICVGVYLRSAHEDILKTIPAYTMIACGFLAMLTGVCWAICHSVKSKLYNRPRGRDDRHVHIYTTYRPSSYPPSYEESQSSHVCPARATDSAEVVDEVVMIISAPPLYTEDSLETPDCTWSWEQPPSYAQTQTALRESAAACAEVSRRVAPGQ
ncbi:transmembrane protein 252-like [Polymixia lowei]